MIIVSVYTEALHSLDHTLIYFKMLFISVIRGKIKHLLNNLSLDWSLSIDKVVDHLSLTLERNLAYKIVSLDLSWSIWQRAHTVNKVITARPMGTQMTA